MPQTLTRVEEMALQQKAGKFGTFIGFLSFIGIILIMAFTIEFDGNKPGGWGYITGIFVVPLIAMIGGVIIGGISFFITFLTLAKLTLNKKK